MLTFTIPISQTFDIELVYGSISIMESFKFTVQSVSKRSNIDCASILNKSITLAFDLPDGKAKRYINGIVTRIEQGKTKQRGTEYTLEIRPKLWSMLFVDE
jgi:uncharacterized protein involved in type VI secretion and phage assembly